MDRLKLSQQMILKVASMIGNEFSYDMICQAFPFQLQNAECAEVRAPFSCVQFSDVDADFTKESM
jgi:predicted ATPase